MVSHSALFGLLSVHARPPLASHRRYPRAHRPCSRASSRASCSGAVASSPTGFGFLDLGHEGAALDNPFVLLAVDERVRDGIVLSVYLAWQRRVGEAGEGFLTGGDPLARCGSCGSLGPEENLVNLCLLFLFSLREATANETHLPLCQCSGAARVSQNSVFKSWRQGSIATFAGFSTPQGGMACLELFSGATSTHPNRAPPELKEIPHHPRSQRPLAERRAFTGNLSNRCDFCTLLQLIPVLAPDIRSDAVLLRASPRKPQDCRPILHKTRHHSLNPPFAFLLPRLAL